MDVLIIIRLLIAVAIIVIIDLILKINKSINIERRLARYSIDSIIEEDNNLGDTVQKKYNHFIKKARKKLNNNKFINKQGKKYTKYIITGDDITIIDFIIIKLLLGIISVALLITSLAIQGRLATLPSMIITFIIGYYIYDIYLYLYNKRRIQKIKNDMLRAVIIMNNAFKAGKSTLQAVEIASDELPKPISIEFKKIYDDLSFGISSDIAFSRFAKRVNLEEAKYLSSSLTILNKTGGNIVAVFSSIEKTLFDKKKLEEDLKNSTAASNLIVKFLMAIPLLFTLIIYILSPTYFDPLFETTLGYMIIFIIIIMFITFIYLLNKIMKVKV